MVLLKSRRQQFSLDLVFALAPKFSQLLMVLAHAVRVFFYSPPQRLWAEKNWGKSRGKEQEKIRELNFAIKISMRNSSNTTRNINKHGRFVFLLTSVEESSFL